jgi:hypothetical protein
MTLNVYADLFDEGPDGVADRLDTAIRAAADRLRTDVRRLGQQRLKGPPDEVDVYRVTAGSAR